MTTASRNDASGAHSVSVTPVRPPCDPRHGAAKP
jgi:hypothetical protein